MTSKVLVKLPVVPFAQQRKKTMPEIIASMPSRKDDTAELVDEAKSEILNCEKITQLEQNLKFLQDQHQITLVSLHQEVEILRQKNRDLQYQLVFTKEPNSVASSPSSPEETGVSLVKPKGSPCNINVTPLQVELLEKDLQDLKTSLNDARKRNVYLSEVIEKQKKSLDLAEKVKEGHKKADVAVQAESMLECQQVEMKARLDDAELLVSKLRQENEDQRKEISNLKSTSAHSSNGSRHGNSRSRGFQNSYHNRSVPNDIQSPEENYQKFPPLQTQSYWHRGPRGNRSNDHNTQSDYYHSSKYQDHHSQDQETSDNSNSALPQLRKGSVRIDNSSSYPPFYRSRDHQHSGGGGSGSAGGAGGGINGGTYYKDDRGNRKYRGQKPQRDRRDQDSRDHHREYREPKENQRQYHEYSDNIPKGPRDYRHNQGQYD